MTDNGQDQEQQRDSALAGTPPAADGEPAAAPDTVQDERDRFYAMLAGVGETVTKNGVNIVFDATANLRTYRDRARQCIPRFIEVFVNAPLSVCERRDVKGLYAKARANQIKEFTGVSAPYEAPENPEINLHTDEVTMEQSVAQIMQYLRASEVHPELGLFHPGI